jgi:hypothetical protein
MPEIQAAADSSLARNKKREESTSHSRGIEAPIDSASRAGKAITAHRGGLAVG